MLPDGTLPSKIKGRALQLSSGPSTWVPTRPRGLGLEDGHRLREGQQCPAPTLSELASGQAGRLARQCLLHKVHGYLPATGTGNTLFAMESMALSRPRSAKRIAPVKARRI